MLTVQVPTGGTILDRCRLVVLYYSLSLYYSFQAHLEDEAAHRVLCGNPLCIRVDPCQFT